MYTNLRTLEAGQDFLRLDECRDYVHFRICPEKNRNHASSHCRSVEALCGSSGLRVLRWIEKHPRDVLYPALLLHSSVCWSESCDMKSHAKKTQSKTVAEIKKWLTDVK
jgi:hypothetical protein